jgi:glycosyltransferase involved in cell wall biosynthesis
MTDYLQHPIPVSVIVSMRNSETTIISCLKGLASQEYPIQEMIVFDNLSTDTSVALVEQYQPICPVPLRLVKQSVNGGLTTSYNTGAELAASSLLVFVHSDSMLPTPQELGHLVAPLLSDPGVVATFSVLLMPEEVWTLFPYWQKHLFARVAMREVPGMCGKFDCIRKAVFLSVGGHNSQRFTPFCGYGGEDSDLNARLKKAGSIKSSSARVVHLHDLGHGYKLSSLFNSRKMLARTYGKIVRFQGLFPVTGKLAFLVKPTLAFLPFMPHLLWLSAAIFLLFSFWYSRRMYTHLSTLFNWRILLVPFVDSALIFHETFWFFEGLLMPAADAPRRQHKLHAGASRDQ